MNDLISRIAEAIEAEIPEAWTESDADFNRGMEMAKSIVESFPSADRPKGEWEERYIDDADIFFKHRFYCNQCGNWNTFGRCDFCPHCGADMRGEKHGTTGDVPDAED